MKLKEKQTVSEKTIVIDIKPTRGLVVALSCVLTGAALLAYLALAGERVAASEAGTSGEASSAQSTGKRQFYLTLTDEFDGSEALTACAPGYHMASIWEMVDPSKLAYNTVLGVTYFPNPDSGQGPPTLGYGWVRTGYASSTSATAGYGNCSAWSSNSGSHSGTTVSLPAGWTAGTEDVGVWDTDDRPCNYSEFVWCIED